MTGKGIFVVRAEVAAADRAAFDAWYEHEHLPEALEAFKAERAWRCWSRLDPAAHIAFYEFRDIERAREIPDSDVLRGLAVKFDEAWGERVPRSRDVFEAVQTLP